MCLGSDVILYVLDARDPEGSRCQEVEQLVEEEGKKLIYINNKVDMVPAENVEGWKAHFKAEGHMLINFQANLMSRRTEGEEKQELSPEMAEQQKNAEKLMKALFKYYLKFAVKKEISHIQVGVVGFTNSGKSSLINCLKNKIICPASSQ